MKTNSILNTLILGLLVLCSSCSGEEGDALPDDPSNPVTEVVTADPVTYEATGNFTFFNTQTGNTSTYSHQYVKINYKDQSHLWANTDYTFLSFYNTNSTAAAEMITLVILGKEMPKTGTYKVGPWPISINGISDADKLQPDEMAVLVVANSLVSKRNSAKTVQVVNDNGKITITASNEIEVYDNIMGEHKGKCKQINLVKTTKKV